MEDKSECFCCQKPIEVAHLIQNEFEVCGNCNFEFENGKVFVFCANCGGGRIFTRDCYKARLAIQRECTEMGNEMDLITFGVANTISENYQMKIFPVKRCPFCVR